MPEKNNLAAAQAYAAQQATINEIDHFSNLVHDLLTEFTRLWWSCGRDFPNLKHQFTTTDQSANEKQLQHLVEGLIYEFKHPPNNHEERQALQARFRDGYAQFAKTALHLNEEHLQFIETCGILESMQSFAKEARAFDPGFTAEDIYQAGRNVMTANFIQLLLGIPVALTPAIFAYSMLYPYSDNYLDDAGIALRTKQSFNQRFQGRLMGDQIQVENQYEEKINLLVEMIENHWDRSEYPLVYESLLAIHTAQIKSLDLIQPGAMPYELDVLNISFEKGGTSVLADGYLVAGTLSREHARYLFGYGTFTQMMDDMEDIDQDTNAGYMSIFSQTANRWPLDHLVNRVFHFGRAVLGDLNGFQSHAAAVLNDLIRICIDPILIDIVGRNQQYYDRRYLAALERHSAFRFKAIRKQRRKIKRKISNLDDVLIRMLA